MSKHGMYKTVEYATWKGMIARCYRPTKRAYRWYGARGIKVCDKWRHDFLAFYTDMGARPSELFSIDRIDSDGDYTPTNCRWATRDTQRSNQRNASGKYGVNTCGISYLSKEKGLNPNAVQKRLYRGWTLEKALNTPMRERTLGR